MAKKNIPGIHNFCDRWCERCAFTSRCAVYENESSLSPDDHDIRNKAFWDRLSQNFTKAKSMIEEAAKKSGVDLDTLQLDLQDTEKKEDERRRTSEQHVIAKLSNEYRVVTDEWLKTQPGMMTKLEKLKVELEAGVEVQPSARDQIETIKESLAVIQWYSKFIYVKFVRALMSRANDYVTQLPDAERDENGSAKIAIIAIERSMLAWSALFELLPEQEDHFLNILSTLEKMKREALTEFPSAMEFVRPGFDEEAG
jgi:hypothetical protein